MMISCDLSLEEAEVLLRIVREHIYRNYDVPNEVPSAYQAVSSFAEQTYTQLFIDEHTAAARAAAAFEAECAAYNQIQEIART